MLAAIHFNPSSGAGSHRSEMSGYLDGRARFEHAFPEVLEEEKQVGQLRITTGVILVEKIKPFEILVWRVCHGVAFLRIVHITQTLTDPDTDMSVKKAVFVVVCHGDNLHGKILRICEAFHCNLYPSPSSAERNRQKEKIILTGIRDTQQVMEQTEDHRRRVLLVAATSIDKWRLQVLKLKSMYHVMNMLQLDEINEFQTAECWVPQSELRGIREKLNRAAERSSNRNDPIIIVKSHGDEEPPTFNRTNKFTKAFQTLVDSYGVSDYREVNPMPYTVVTFPFLFSVMFGDVGHGAILVLFAAFLVFEEEKLRRSVSGEIRRILFEGRYVILLMGIFSIYTGLIYNDFFSKSVKLTASSWLVDHNVSEIRELSKVQLDPVSHFAGRSYVFGIDPIWQCSENKIIFLNSFKMKMSVILGVLHMFFGMVLGAGNHLHFRRYYNIYAELVPEMIYFVCLFAYLAFLILAKWVAYGPLEADCAPNILITFMDMVMFKEATHSCSRYMYPNQTTVQTVLVTLALLTVPWTFVAKTGVLLRRRRHRDSDESDVFGTKQGKLTFPGEDFDYERSDVGEIIIHQGIRTIEFVLGSVSHTASYLRLWALSLAHSQLSDVLWKMVMRFGVAARGGTGGIWAFVCFAVWATLTVAILVLMEGLSAFLHALRLHWVEFQTKFFSGSGHLFRPYSFERIFDMENSSGKTCSMEFTKLRKKCILRSRVGGGEEEEEEEAEDEQEEEEEVQRSGRRTSGNLHVRNLFRAAR
ncbi:UNVERIFIED_CONTAM: hypothetical protein PYX00_010602 [Menopon gallinae]|uniref:V-type proton ATPase subunit a n=1 Tax=Menopon gallinae TaxID=328185 RepID=A0AAW2HGL3_9NEOP